MDVILLQDIAQVGKSGETVHVKDGYGRNFLIPRGWAVAATPGAGKQAQAQVQARLKSARMQKEKALELAGRLEQVACVIAAPVGSQGKLHGAVTAADIAAALGRQGIALDKHQVDLEKPLTVLGDAQVHVRLHPEVKVSVRVSVVSQ